MELISSTECSGRDGVRPDSAPNDSVRSFQFERDTFTFVNELVWQYHFDPATGAMTISNTDPPPTYSHRCFVVVRSARQFLYHARFEPGLPKVEALSYLLLIRQVVNRNPRWPSKLADRVVIPGYACLRAFSQAHEGLLKTGCGGPWRSYFLRSHWRMVFPVWRSQQELVAKQLYQAVRQGSVPAAHLFCFPRITINHGILLFGLTESEWEFQFDGYDPNISDHPVKLIYDRASRTFRFPATRYWAGGALNVIQIFRGGLY
jgi:hypothetical protein